MEKELAKHSPPKEGAIPDNANASYLHVFLVVLIGGIIHLFIDTIGHVEDVGGGTYEFLGHIELVTPFSWDVILCYGIVAVGIIGGIILWYAYSRGASKVGVKTILKTAFLSPHTRRIALFVGVALGNVIALYGVMALGGLATIDTQTFPWNSVLYDVVVFDLKNALLATKFYTEEAGKWYTVAVICAFLVLFVVVHSRGLTLKIRGRSLKAEYILVASAIGAILVGYLLQPVIGNISNNEADFGAFIFLWAFLGFPLVTASPIRGKPAEVPPAKRD